MSIQFPRKHCQQFLKRYQHYLTEKKDAAKEAEVEHEIKVIDEKIKMYK